MAGQSINFHFQKNAFVEKFRPLTYYEIATGKELIAPIPGSKYVFRSPMHSITTVLRFHELSTGLLAPVERMMEASAQKTSVAPDKLSNDSVALIQGVVAIAKVLWELADKPKNPFTRRKMWKDYSKAFMTDTVWFFDLLQKFKDFNQRFFFYNEVPTDLQGPSGSEVGSDGLLDFTGGSCDPNTTPFIVVLACREAEKAGQIRQHELNKQAEKKNKLKRHGR